MLYNYYLCSRVACLHASIGMPYVRVRVCVSFTGILKHNYFTVFFLFSVS